MKFELTAPIVEIGVIESFGANGFQKRNLILLEQNGEYENPVCVEFSGDKIERPDSHQIGQMVIVSGFINCREYEGRYFTSLRGSFIKNAEQPEQPAQPQQQFGAQPTYAPQQNVAPQYQQPNATQQPQQQYQQQPANMAPPQLDANGMPF